jgi:hypothetical protein
MARSTKPKVVFHCEADLLSFFDCKTTEDLQDRLSDDGYGEYWIYFDDQPRDNGFTIVIGNRGTGLTYPFDQEEFHATVDGLESEMLFQWACEELAASILAVEGFHVQVDVDYSAESVPARVHRRVVDSGAAVQDVPDYPYSRAISSVKSFRDWQRTRFEKHYPGLQVHLRWPAPHCEQWPLDRLRTYQSREARTRTSPSPSTVQPFT